MPTPLIDLIEILQLSEECEWELKEVVCQNFSNNNSISEISRNIIPITITNGDGNDIENITIDSEDSLRSNISYDTSYEAQEAKRELSDTPPNSHEETSNFFETDYPSEILSPKPNRLHESNKCFYDNKSIEQN